MIISPTSLHCAVHCEMFQQPMVHYLCPSEVSMRLNDYGLGKQLMIPFPGLAGAARLRGEQDIGGKAILHTHCTPHHCIIAQIGSGVFLDLPRLRAVNLRHNQLQTVRQAWVLGFHCSRSEQGYLPLFSIEFTVSGYLRQTAS